MPAGTAELQRRPSERAILASVARDRSRGTGPEGRASRYEESSEIGEEHPRGRSG
jgi:hypothetical protein